MAFNGTSTPISFSGVADDGVLQIKPADVYVGTLNSTTHEVQNLKYLGLTNQQLELTISQEEQEYKQNGAARKVVPISKSCDFKFRADQWDDNTFAWALGLANTLVDAANGTKRIIISADSIAPVEWYVVFKSETVDGTPVEIHIPKAVINVDGSIQFGGGNESPNFGGLSIAGKALAADILGEGGLVQSALAFYDFKYTNVPVTGVSGLPATLAIAVAEEVILTPVVAPSNASDTRVSFSTSAAAKATVDAFGKVIGVAAGNANITVTTVDGSFTDVCAVTVS